MESLHGCIKGGGFTHVLYNNAEMVYRRDIRAQEIQAKPDLWNAFSRRYIRGVFRAGDADSFKQTGVWCSVGEIN